MFVSVHHQKGTRSFRFTGEVIEARKLKCGFGGDGNQNSWNIERANIHSVLLIPGSSFPRVVP